MFFLMTLGWILTHNGSKTRTYGCAFLGVHTMADNILGFTFSRYTQMAFVQASANGFKMNDVMED